MGGSMKYPKESDFLAAQENYKMFNRDEFIDRNFNFLRHFCKDLHGLIMEEIERLCFEGSDYMDLKACLSILIECFRDCQSISSSTVAALKIDLTFLSSSDSQKLNLAEKFEQEDEQNRLLDKEEDIRQAVINKADEFISRNFKAMFSRFNSFIKVEYSTVYRNVMEISKIFILAIVYEQGRKGVTAQIDDILGKNKSGL